MGFVKVLRGLSGQVFLYFVSNDETRWANKVRQNTCVVACTGADMHHRFAQLGFKRCYAFGMQRRLAIIDATVFC